MNEGYLTVDAFMRYELSPLVSATTDLVELLDELMVAGYVGYVPRLGWCWLKEPLNREQVSIYVDRAR